MFSFMYIKYFLYNKQNHHHNNYNNNNNHNKYFPFRFKFCSVGKKKSYFELIVSLNKRKATNNTTL
jgi:hypothetical protein